MGECTYNITATLLMCTAYSDPHSEISVFLSLPRLAQTPVLFAPAPWVHKTQDEQDADVSEAKLKNRLTLTLFI